MVPGSAVYIMMCRSLPRTLRSLNGRTGTQTVAEGAEVIVRLAQVAQTARRAATSTGAHSLVMATRSPLHR